RVSRPSLRSGGTRRAPRVGVIDQVVFAVGAVLSVGGLVVAAVVGRSPSRSLLEITYVVLPIIGAVVIAAMAWSRL
ncbi:MAG: hypothetical protein AAB198_00575, partial [Actinomycetota bacterium]